MAPAGASRPSPTAATRPPSTTTSAMRSPVMSTTRPPRITTRRSATDGALPEQEEEHRHAHGDAVGHLAGDERPGQVGHVGRDLDAPVDGARVHDQGVL